MEFSYLSTCPARNMVPLSPEKLCGELQTRVMQGWRMVALCGAPQHLFETGALGVGLLCLLVHDGTSRCLGLRTGALTRYPSLTLHCPQAHWFEREIYEQWGILPEGHPWLKPLRFTPPPGGGPSPLPGDTAYFCVEGGDVHEVAVGPVHAGVIEPGHFRFQCYGERVMHLEISLGFQHRGLEALLRGSSYARNLRLVECVAGDTSIGHATAFTALLETLGSPPATARGQALRSVALELERLACHVGDLGALGGDVGFLPALSWCGRIRGDFLNLTALLCGNRFGRGMVCLSGTAHDVDAHLIRELLKRLDSAHRDARGAVDVMLASASVRDRFERTGTVSTLTARELGLVGVAAKASGLAQDARYHYPLTPTPASPATLRVQAGGDVLARTLVRSEEMDDAVTIIRQTLDNLPKGPCRTGGVAPPALEPGLLAVAFVEGWRGTVCHVGISGVGGHLDFYKIIDPSFHNWIGLAVALRGQEISDFPLCNKSFNLSYCGHDL